MKLINPYVCSLVLLHLCIATIGYAAEKAKDTVVYDKKTSINFEDKVVDGQFQSPDGASVKGDEELEFDSLLADKENFGRENKRLFMGHSYTGQDQVKNSKKGVSK